MWPNLTPLLINCGSSYEQIVVVFLCTNIYSRRKRMLIMFSIDIRMSHPGAWTGVFDTTECKDLLISLMNYFPSFAARVSLSLDVEVVMLMLIMMVPRTKPVHSNVML